MEIQTTLRIDEKLLEKVRKVADIEERSINSQINFFIKMAIKHYEEKNE